MSDLPAPSPEDRRQAVCAALASGPGLVRYAARYTTCIEDAEDAYQRALEIALTKAPVTEKRRFLAWLFTVLKHEAMAITRSRSRESPGGGEDVGVTLADAPAEGDEPHRTTEGRLRYRALQDALASLSDAQRVCVMLQSAGASYQAIATITGYSRRKVERSVLEGRKSLHTWELRLAQGEVCDGLLDAIEHVASGEATAREARSVRRHLRHCHACTALLRSRRQSRDWLGALVPAGLLASEVETALEPDPSPAFAYWERAGETMAFRLTQLSQLATEVYAAATTKVGIGAATVAIAGAAGGPVVVDAVKPDPQPAPAAIEASSHSTAEDPAVPVPRRSTTTAARPQTSGAPQSAGAIRVPPRKRAVLRPSKESPSSGSSRDTSPPTPKTVVVTTSPPPAAVQRAPSPRAPSSSPAPSMALEFGP